ncbi:single-stranded DNA-binding protein [Streptomyces californicus]|uniref:Single-stranded DNA-binding protein n=1 Tax=Streptomyces californicus TaxID=67351 RepID=A0ABX7J291_9ACTN|nr:MULTISPECIES: single-stranded DNA-binding protein [Streptomyces]QRV28779.1 single-stranded DNA-binding protein [Streptomyces californicus]QRV42193.1 single-stranded DNA-binding protein [Streptomyces californicus]
MALPTMTGVGRLTNDPELRFTPNGKAVASVPLAFNSRKLNRQTQEWEDGDVLYVRGSAWERLAENLVETLAKGMEVIVTGELRTESWEKDGQKHERTALLIRSIAPSLVFATAKVTKVTTGQNGGQGGGQARGQAQQRRPQQSRPTQPPADDPWAIDNARGHSDEPPF